MGLETDFRKLRARGWKPLVVGGGSWLFISTFSLVLIETELFVKWRRAMAEIIRAIIGSSVPTDGAPLDKIIALGKKALRQKADEELARDLLGLDGVRLPLERDPGVN